MHNLISHMYAFGDFTLDAQGQVLRRGQEPVPLTPKAFDVLLLLIENPGKVVTKDELMRAVWRDSFVEESNLTQTVFMLRKALGETTERRYILTVQGQGYRFLVPVQEVIRGGPPGRGAQAVSASDLNVIPSELWMNRGKLTKPRLALISSGACLVILGAALGIWAWLPRHGSAQPHRRIMLAVLPFQNLTGDPGQDYFSDGMTEEMLTQLGNLDPQHLGVIARTSVMHYKDTQAPLDQIGRELGAQYVIEGSVRRYSGRVRISAQLIQVQDQSHIWARQYDRELKDLLAVQGEIAQEIASEVQTTLGDRSQFGAARRSTPPAAASYEAYDLYLRGLYFWNKRSGEGFNQAKDYFQQAIARDPNYAPAYAGLADTFGLTSAFFLGRPNELMPKARAAALKALQLDGSLAEAHTALGLVAEDYDYDWQTAEKEFWRAIELNPNYATAHQWYGEYLSWQGRFDQALAESERARELDPMSLIIARDHGAILYRARQYDRAIEQFHAVLGMDPGFCSGCGYLVNSYVQEGRFQEALDEVNRYVRPLSKPGAVWALALEATIYGEWGRKAEAERALARFEDADRIESDAHNDALLGAYIGMRRRDQAMALLQKFFAEHSNVIPALKTDATYDPLRSDPRFQDLLRRAGLAD